MYIYIYILYIYDIYIYIYIYKDINKLEQQMLKALTMKKQYNGTDNDKNNKEQEY